MQLNKYHEFRPNPKLAEISTSPELVEYLLCKIPDEIYLDENKTFFDFGVGTGIFITKVVEKIMSFGYSFEEASKRVSGCDTRIKYINRLKRRGYNVFKKDILQTDKEFEEFIMKQDVILGNPPFQDGNAEGQQNKIYNQISKKMLSLLKPTGIMGPWLTPVSVLKKSKRFSFIGRQGLQEVDFTANEYFNVGVRICSTILNKSYEGDVTVINSKGVSSIEPNEMIFDYTLIDETFTKIYQRIKSLNFNSPDKRGFYYNNFGPVTSKKKTEEHKYELHKLMKNGEVKLFTYLNREPYLYGKKKLVISRTRQFNESATIVSNKDFNVGHVFIDIDNDQEVENVKSFLFSDYFISHCQKWKTLEGYGFNDALIYLPKFDKTKMWTNEEVKDFIESL